MGKYPKVDLNIETFRFEWIVAIPINLNLRKIRQMKHRHQQVKRQPLQRGDRL